jgi:hypothetical protein
VANEPRGGAKEVACSCRQEQTRPEKEERQTVELERPEREARQKKRQDPERKCDGDVLVERERASQRPDEHRVAGDETRRRKHRREGDRPRVPKEEPTFERLMSVQGERENASARDSECRQRRTTAKGRVSNGSRALRGELRLRAHSHATE